MKKIISYIGFAKKSNNILVGQSQIKHTKKSIHVILVCNTASDNLKNLAKNVANKHNCEWITTKINLSELTNLQDIKIVAITDESLSKAIIENKENINIG